MFLFFFVYEYIVKVIRKLKTNILRGFHSLCKFKNPSDCFLHGMRL